MGLPVDHVGAPGTVFGGGGGVVGDTLPAAAAAADGGGGDFGVVESPGDARRIAAARPDTLPLIPVLRC